MMSGNLEIFLLGSPIIREGDHQIEFDTRKALALLAYLVITGTTHQRDTLATFFWPENDQAGARAALRRTLSVLKAGLLADSLLVTREQIGINPAGRWWCDAHEYSRLIYQTGEQYHRDEHTKPEYINDLSDAVKLYRGDFLAGFSLRDSPAFDDWQYLQTEVYKQKLAIALSQLALAYCDRNSFTEAIGHARRLLGLDPLREEAHRLLMLCYARAGQRTTALQQYRNCVRILDQELGVPPLEETTKLYTQILEGEDFALQSSAAETDRITIPATPESGLDRRPDSYQFPLVGRSRQMEIMLKRYQIDARRGYLLVLLGEPGIGKTRLADNFLAFAQKQGAKIMSARCFPGEKNLAYSIFTDAFQSLAWTDALLDRLRQLPQTTLREAARLVPALASLQQSSPDEEWNETSLGRARFFDAIRQVILTSLSGDPPGVFFLDDIHWADPASLELLSFLTRRLPGYGLMILLTTSNGPMPEILEQLIYEQQRAQTGNIIELNRLSEAELLELVGISMRTEPRQTQEIAARLYRESEGLPFFIIEYLDLLLQEKRAGGNIFNLSQQELPIPNNVIHLIKTRLSDLDEKTWQVLTTAAVIGRSFDFETLQAVSGRSDQETILSLEILLSKGIVEEISHAPDSKISSYDFSHDKLRQYVTQQTSSVRRRLLHRRMAETLIQQQRGSREPMIQSGLIAQHYQQAGQDELAAGFYQAAGDQARSIYAHRLAIQYYQDALAAGAKDLAILHENLGDLHTRIGEYRAAITSYHRAAALANPDAQARLEQELGNVHHRRGDYDLAESHYRAALELVTSDSLETSSIYIDLSQVERLRGNLEPAYLLANQALALAEANDWRELIARAHNHLGILARVKGDFEKARRHLETSLEITRLIQELSGEVAALNNLAMLLAEEGDYNTSIQCTQSALEICRKIGYRHQEAAILNHLSELYHTKQEEERSMAYLKQAAAIFTEIGADGDAFSPSVWMLSEW
jgi:DNA-binding SARP family transcriptional activator